MCIFKFLTCFFVLFTICNGADLEEEQPAVVCSASTADPAEQQEAKELAKWLVDSHRGNWDSQISQDYRIEAKLIEASDGGYQ